MPGQGRRVRKLDQHVKVAPQDLQENLFADNDDSSNGSKSDSSFNKFIAEHEAEANAPQKTTRKTAPSARKRAAAHQAWRAGPKAKRFRFKQWEVEILTPLVKKWPTHNTPEIFKIYTDKLNAIGGRQIRVQQVKDFFFNSRRRTASKKYTRSSCNTPSQVQTPQQIQSIVDELIREVSPLREAMGREDKQQT